MGKRKKKQQHMFYVDIPKAGEYKPFVTKKERDKIIRDYLKGKKRKKSSIFDLDNDGVPNLLDCKPGDPTKQDIGGGEEPSYLLDGYDIEDYYFTGTGYELRPEAKPSKSWVKEQKRKRR